MDWIFKSFDELTNEELYAVLKLRFEVFVIEQNCLDIDPDGMLMYGREAQSKTRIASPATIPKSGERNRKIHSCMLYLISI